jgi:hypothetical protein
MEHFKAGQKLEMFGNISARLYLWETAVTPRGFSSVATLWP